MGAVLFAPTSNVMGRQHVAQRAKGVPERQGRVLPAQVGRQGRVLRLCCHVLGHCWHVDVLTVQLVHGLQQEGGHLLTGGAGAWRCCCGGRGAKGTVECVCCAVTKGNKRPVNWCTRAWRPYLCPLPACNTARQAL